MARKGNYIYHPAHSSRIMREDVEGIRFVPAPWLTSAAGEVKPLPYETHNASQLKDPEVVIANQAIGTLQSEEVNKSSAQLSDAQMARTGGGAHTKRSRTRASPKGKKGGVKRKSKSLSKGNKKGKSHKSKKVKGRGQNKTTKRKSGGSKGKKG